MGKADQARLLKCQEKMLLLTERSNIIEQGDAEMKRKQKKSTERHKAELKIMEEKYKESLEHQTKLSQQLRKTKQDLKTFSHHEKLWEKKIANHHGEVKQLKLQHQKELQQREEQKKIEQDQANEKLAMIEKQKKIVEMTLENSNAKEKLMEMELVEEKNKLKEREQAFESTLKLRELESKRQWEEREQKLQH